MTGLAALAVLSAGVPPGLAWAQPPPAPKSLYFDIPAGPLPRSLQTFSLQSGLQVVTSVDLHATLGRKLQGYLTPRAALEAMLQGQALSLQEVAGGFVIQLRPHPDPARSAEAQAPATAPTPQEIVVTGYRQSLIYALDLKRQAVGTEDVILSEDIAAFPDLNLAESLQRIPGITITRDSGEGRQISIRGLGPDFSRTQLNGMEVLGNTASGMDNRGGVSRTRAFDYSLFASELFDKVVAQKSYSADEDEGGIGGTVQLSTAKPFDFPGFKAVVSAKGVDNANASGTTPRLAALISDRWGAFGALISATYSAENSNEFGYRSYGWGQIHINPANIGPGVSAADAARLTSTDPATEIFAPQADTYSTWFDHRTRLGSTLSLQYQPSAKLKLGFDALYSELENQRNDYALAASGTNSLTGNVTGTQVLQSDVISGASLVQARYTGVDLRSEYNIEKDTTRFWQVVANGQYELTPRLSVQGLIGSSSSTYDLPVFDKVFLESKDQAFSFDDRPSMPVNTYGFDTTDPNQWNLMRLDTQENNIVSTYDTARLDLIFRADEHSTFSAGTSFKRFRNSGYQYNNKVFHNVPTDIAIPNGLKGAVPYDTLGNYIVGDVDGVYALIGDPRNLNAAYTMPDTNFVVTEATVALYVKYDLKARVLDRPFRLDFGVRYYSTGLTSQGQLNNGTSLQPVTVKHSYDGVLPALNVAVDLKPNLVARFSANRDISRPALSDLAAAGSLTTAPFGGTIFTGNPDLKPFMSDSVEGSLEYYQGRIGAFSLGVFYKKLQSFITTQTSVVPYASTGFPLSFLLPGQDGSIPYNVSHPVNGPGADIKGVEAAFQRDFDFLPGALHHLGMVANATYADGSTPVIFSGVPINLPLSNLSRYTANATLYYETRTWGMRVSEAYRDKYLIGAGSNGNIGEFIKAQTYLDVSAHYNVTPHLKLTFEGVNLNNEHQIQYTDITAKRIEVNTSSGRTLLLGAAFEF